MRLHSLRSWYVWKDAANVRDGFNNKGVKPWVVEEDARLVANSKLIPIVQQMILPVTRRNRDSLLGL